MTPYFYFVRNINVIYVSIVIKSYFSFEIYMKLLFTSKRHNPELHKQLSSLEITETVIFIFVSLSYLRFFLSRLRNNCFMNSDSIIILRKMIFIHFHNIFLHVVFFIKYILQACFMSVALFWINEISIYSIIFPKRENLKCVPGTPIHTNLRLPLRLENNILFRFFQQIL